MTPFYTDTTCWLTNKPCNASWEEMGITNGGLLGWLGIDLRAPG